MTMAASPRWKIYDSEGTYQGATKEIEAAAALVAFYGPGATIKSNHRIVVWTEGVDGCAADSYDAVAEKASSGVF
jgi:hypothetical protein